MNNLGGIVKKEEGFLDIVENSLSKVYKYKGEIYTILLDGEIYNEDELREDLLSRGDYFNTNDNEELVLKIYLAYGTNALKKFEGVFSFAIYFHGPRKLFIARDPIGAKPMFFSILNDGVIFANNISCILKTNLITPEVTYEGITELMVLGPSKCQNSAIFRNIKQLESGSYLEFTYPEISIHKYEDFEAYEFTDSFEDTVDNIRERVIDSVLKQYPRNQEVCTLLSGGLDSSIVTTIVSDIKKQNGETLKTFSVDYEGNETFFKANDFQPNSDYEWIVKMVEFLNTDHTTIKLSSEDLVDSLNLGMNARGLPGMGDIDTSLLKFCEKMRTYAEVGMGGECADEVFGGYPWFHKPELINSGFFPWIRSIHERNEYINDEIKYNVNAENLAKNIYYEELKRVPTLKGENEKERKVREIGYLTYRWFLPVLLERQDKMAGCANFKIRAPFCNFELMKYVYNIPWEYKMKDGMEKGILRYAFKDLLPKEVVERKKSPYPKTFNPRYKELVIRELKHILENPTSPLLDIINIDKVYELINQSENESRPWFGQLMRGPQVMAFFIQVNNWLKEYRVTIV